jgi:hypothetical protein
MFDSKFTYPINQPLKKSGPSNDGDLRSWEYKVKTTKKKTYVIKVCEYKHDVHFIKFYPTKLSGAKDKYKKRLGNTKEFSRLIGTCFALAFKIMKKNEDAIFGFYGQWDKVDVEREDEISQRYRIYKRAVISILSKSEKYKFNFTAIDQINTFFIFPAHLPLEVKIDQLRLHFSTIFTNENINDLIIPKKTV